MVKLDKSCLLQDGLLEQLLRFLDQRLCADFKGYTAFNLKLINHIFHLKITKAKTKMNPSIKDEPIEPINSLLQNRNLKQTIPQITYLGRLTTNTQKKLKSNSGVSTIQEKTSFAQQHQTGGSHGAESWVCWATFGSLPKISCFLFFKLATFL